MCGIAGKISFCNETREKLEEEILNMLSVIKHRGPDGQGIFSEERVVIGMRRLSIIGLKNGWQPIWNESRDIVCVANGEIYNYKELKISLQKSGHHFYTDSDIEVIVHLYEEYGKEFVNSLNGMFAIALYDKKINRLLLYRDRIGKKPLYYHQNAHGFYFASEIKSILTCSQIERAISLDALNYLLTYNYLPNQLTIFNNIYKLMPGEYMVIENKNIYIEKYWQLLDSIKDSTVKKSEKDVLYELDDLLQDSVKLRLRSDVPIGAFLSGGVDSSVVVSYATAFCPHLDTFSIGFNEEEYNELPYSRIVSDFFQTIHHEEIVASNFFDLLPRTIWLNDNPHGDISFLPTYVLAQMTSKYVKTVLTGDGGDELFGGYDKYLSYLSNKDLNEVDFYEMTSVFNSKEKKLLYDIKLRDQIEKGSCLDYIKEITCPFLQNYDDRLNRLLYLETKLLLEGNNLVKPDRMGMGNSIEARMPLLDYRIIEYMMRLPGEYKIKGNETKYILKLLAAKRLPKEIVYRKKQMFTVPIGEWMKSSLKSIFYDILLSKRCLDRKLFNGSYIKTMLDAHVNGKANYTRQLRLLIIIELWHRIYIDNCFLEAPDITSLL